MAAKRRGAVHGLLSGAAGAGADRTRPAAQASPSKRRWEGAAEVYLEGRRTRRPTARQILDLLEHLRRSDLLQASQTNDHEPLLFYDDLSPAQQRLLTLLGIDPRTDER